MKKIIASLLILFAGQDIFAQGIWQWMSPVATGNTVLTSYFINAQTGWGAGRNGTIIKTTNGGVNWKTQSIDRAFQPSTIYFTNENTGWIAGNAGKIFKTTDGGNSWDLQATPFPNDCKQIQFVNSLTGYCATIGSLFKTTTGGSNWFTPPIGGNFYGVQFFNESKGYLFTQEYFLKTYDSGNTWSAVTPGWFSAANCFSFKDTSFGVVAGMGFLYTTTNGGLNWYSSYSGTEEFTSVNMHPSSVGIATTRSNKILRTYGGLSWTTGSTPFFNSNLAYYNSFIVDAGNAFVFGDNGVILKAASNATVFTSLTNRITSYNINNIVFVNSLTGFVSSKNASTTYGAGGPALKTTNGGLNWTALQMPPGYFQSIYFLNSQTGWICGDSMKVAKTTNSGANWTVQYGASSMSPLVSIEFCDSLFGWTYASFGGYNYKTTNGGTNWVSFTNPGSFSNIKIFFLNSLTGWAIGTSSTSQIRKTTDGGATWFSQFNTNPNNLSVHFVNSQTGWICGGEFISKTTNGGTNWNDKAYPGKYFRAIKFYNANMGLCIGANGDIFATVDGGNNWSSQSRIYCSSLNTISFIDNTNILIGGDAGIILKSSLGIIDGANFIQSSLSEQFSLSQNYPNPFNPSTVIRYQLSVAGNVSLKIFDLLGKEVAQLVNEKQSAGSYAVDFNSAEYNLPSGIYFYTLNAGEFKETKKMILIK
ncbi:MAG: T9SS type A sorting domain-containing protein [Bacteroidetes bacterium]|nr:T9SS type A sorting domain-containing protein [Bacteroidota bacterium]